MRVLLTCLALASSSCGGAEEPPDTGAARRSGPPPEAISTRMGEREVRVRCFVECVDLVEELTRLHRGCVRDPMSTPHHVATEAATISLGCCTEARSAYEELCGAEGPAGPCVSEWGARCDAGLLGEATP